MKNCGECRFFVRHKGECHRGPPMPIQENMLNVRFDEVPVITWYYPSVGPDTIGCGEHKYEGGS